MVASLSRQGNAALVLLGVLALGGVAAGCWLLTRSDSPQERDQQAAQEAPPTIANSIGMKFVRVPKGKFLMGSPAEEAERGPDETQHEVVLTKDFFLGVHEVTQSQYEKVMGANPSFFAQTGPGKYKIKGRDTAQHPVEQVTWRQAVEFCKRLGELPEEKERKRTYRLPTEAEWEYACRGGTTTALAFGDVVDSYAANFNGLSPYGASGRNGPFYRCTAAVGHYAANKFGVYDMHGNVMEWCQDWYAADYYSKSPKEDPPGPPDGAEKVTRGGGWPNSGKACRSAVRTKLRPEESHYALGFRVVMMMTGD